MSYTDRELNCLDCPTTFIFSSDDQSFHAEKGYSDPKRCPNCRKEARSRRNNRGGGGGGFGRDRGPRELFSIECSDCNKEAKVPPPFLSLNKSFQSRPTPNPDAINFFIY